MKKAPPSTPKSVVADIARLRSMSWQDLRALWGRLMPDALILSNRRYVERRLAHRLQEIEYRKVERNVLDRNRRRIDALVDEGQIRRRREAAMPVAGTVLCRDYDGVTHCVTVQPDGRFAYGGRSFASLSAVAREITGTRWSGPAFFGLREPLPKRAARR